MTDISRRTFLLASLGSIVAPSVADAASWRLLGTRAVNIVEDHDVIPVTFLQGSFRAIRLRVRDNGIFINSLGVIYGNGVPENIPIRYFIPAGGESRVIDLRGGRRFIRNVQLLYRSVPNGSGRATVEIWGLG